MSSDRLNKIERMIAEIESKNPDDPRLIALEEEANQIADEISARQDRVNTHHEAQLEASALTRRLNDIKFKIAQNSGLQFNDWFEIASKMYTIAADFTVTSYARDWQEVKTWPCDNLAEAYEVIFKLMTYKDTDRNRGFSSREEDVERVELLANAGIIPA